MEIQSPVVDLVTTDMAVIRAIAYILHKAIGIKEYMFRLALNDLKCIYRSDKACVLLMLTSLFISFVMFIFWLGRVWFFYMDYVDNSYYSTSTFTMESSSGDPYLVEVCNEICKDDSFKVVAVSLSDYEMSGVNLSEENYPIMEYGTYFTESQLVNAERVLLVGQSYLKKAGMEHPEAFWNTPFAIGEIMFQPIGQYMELMIEPNPQRDYKYLLLPTGIAVPLTTYEELNRKPLYLHIEFEGELTDEQVNILKMYAYCDDVWYRNDIEQPYTESGLYKYFSLLLSYLLFFLIAIINIAVVLNYFLRKEQRRYSIYQICGAGHFAIRKLRLYSSIIPVTLAYLISVVLGVICIYLMPSGIVLPLPWSQYVILYVIVFFIVISISVVLPKRMNYRGGNL